MKRNLNRVSFKSIAFKSFVFLSAIVPLGAMFPAVAQETIQPSLSPERLQQLTTQLVTVNSSPLPPLGDPARFLPVPAPAIALVIDLSDRRVYVHEDRQVKTSFPIAIGRSGWETPTGEFEVIQMLTNPAWQNPLTGEIIPAGADNPLGQRWIAFWTDGRNYIGFHGTPNEESVGRAASHGCIRMYNRDVSVLYEMVSVGTPVTVVP